MRNRFLVCQARAVLIATFVQIERSRQGRATESTARIRFGARHEQKDARRSVLTRRNQTETSRTDPYGILKGTQAREISMSKDTQTHADYLFAQGTDETRRLRRQADFLSRFTRYLLDSAGITSGMKVLDVGTGIGDVAKTPRRCP